MRSCIELKINSTLRTQTEDDKLVILILKLSQFNPLNLVHLFIDKTKLS